RGPGRVLPDRPFDLPSLRAMDANVLVDIDYLDLGSTLVEPLRPMRTHLTLAGAVLRLADIDARTGAGSLSGQLQLDGRAAQALWNADLRWRDVRLERWLHQARKTGGSGDKAPPPYITGRLNGRAQVVGQGASTAAILGSLRGDVRMQLVGGSVSHLAVEAAGLDVAQALGVMIKGDDALPIDCTVADLAADHGVLRPRALVLDTRDSTLWADGSLSLADESLNLRLLVSPKDFSPLALRTPVHVRGTFAAPKVSIEAGGLAGRVGAAAALAFVNPLAAVLPFFDTGNDEDARRSAQACRALAARSAG
ncbi:MAG TPA: AsmA-like C-terminal region-containing protein, partial [Burkholderiaceae bacterium]|nr:AsmA-like C-terminal region-containing protein [Burkholderiaceae bacterium]